MPAKLSTNRKEVKATAKILLPRDLPPVCEDAVHAAIHAALIGSRAALTVPGFARKVNRADTTVYHWAHPTDPKAMDLASFATLVREATAAGDFRLIELMLPTNMRLVYRTEGKTDGSVVDELALMVEYGGAVKRYYDNGDIPRAKLEYYELCNVENQLGLELEAKQ